MRHFLKNRLDQGLAALFIVSVLLILVAGEDPFVRDGLCNIGVCFRAEHSDAWNRIFFELSIATIVSLLFYVLIVRIPEHQRRARLKKRFRAEYASFKYGCIDIFLVLSKSQTDTETMKKLMSLDAFRAYFKENVGNGQDRWDAFCNGLNDHYMLSLNSRLEIFRDEVRELLNKIDIEDDEISEFLKRLSSIIHMNRTLATEAEYDTVKMLAGFLWSIFTGWSWVTGYPDRDLIEKMIDAI